MSKLDTGSVNDDDGNGIDAVTVLKPIGKIKPKRPNMYRVIILNDDYTGMDFVVYIIQKVFNKSKEEASALMMEVHTNGKAIVGVYTYEVAETKIMEAVSIARSKEFPLLVVMEKE